jgi:hypothetical protein
MKAADWIRALAVTALMASACGSTPTAGTAPSPTASPSSAASPSASPTAAKPCPPPSNRCLALVTLRGSSSYVVRDITDIAHGKTLSTVAIPSTASQIRFVSATDLSSLDGDSIYRMLLAGSPKTLIAKSSVSVFNYTWSPDGKTAAYLAYKDSTSPGQLHLVSGGRDRVAGSVPSRPAVGCESAGCADQFDVEFAYSPDGKFISLVQNVIRVVFRVWTPDGVDVTPGGILPVQSVWAGSGLYFVGAKGIDVWRNGTVTLVHAGAGWVRPNAAPDGAHIVYQTIDSAGWAHTYLLDTTSGKVRDLGKGRTTSTFLTSRYLWYAGQRACLAADQCDPHFPVTLSGKTYIYDLQDGTPTESIITDVADVWPHAA